MRTVRYNNGGMMNQPQGGASKLNTLLSASRGTVDPERARKIESNTFYNVSTDPQGFTYFIGDDGDDGYVKTPDGQMMHYDRGELINALGDQSDLQDVRVEGKTMQQGRQFNAGGRVMSQPPTAGLKDMFGR